MTIFLNIVTISSQKLRLLVTKIALVYFVVWLGRYYPSVVHTFRFAPVILILFLLLLVFGTCSLSTDSDLGEQFPRKSLFKAVSESVVNEPIISRCGRESESIVTNRRLYEVSVAELVKSGFLLDVILKIFLLHSQLPDLRVLLVGSVSSSINQDVGEGKEEEAYVTFRHNQNLRVDAKQVVGLDTG